MADAPAPSRTDSSRRRKWFFTGITVDFILAGLMLLMGALAQATSPTGRGPGLELLVMLAIFILPPAVGWGLYNNTRLDVRWLLLLVWTPVVLLAIGIPLSIIYA